MNIDRLSQQDAIFLDAFVLFVEAFSAYASENRSQLWRRRSHPARINTYLNYNLHVPENIFLREADGCLLLLSGSFDLSTCSFCDI